MSEDVCLEHLYGVLAGYVRAAKAARVMAPEAANPGLEKYICGQDGCGKRAIFNVAAGSVPESLESRDKRYKSFLETRGFTVIPPGEVPHRDDSTIAGHGRDGALWLKLDKLDRKLLKNSVDTIIESGVNASNRGKLLQLSKRLESDK